MRSRSDMRRALEEAELRERRAHAGARLLLNRHEGQAIVLFQEPERGQRGLDRARVRLDEVRLHEGQQAVVLGSRRPHSPRSARSVSRAIASGTSFETTDTTPSAPSAINGRVMASSPESTQKFGGRSRRIAMICARSAEASFVPTMLARSPARVSVVAAVMLDAVRPGTLYRTTGRSSTASATARKWATRPAWVGLL